MADPPATPLLQRLGERVRARRHARGLTLRELSEASGLSSRFLVELERGRANISVGRLAGLADALGETLPALLAAGDGPPALARLHARLAALDAAGLARAEAALDGLLAAGDAPPVLALLGVRGAGKSTVGPPVARRLGRDFVELDRLVEEAAGLALDDLFALHGPALYRTLEHEVLGAFLAAGRRAVLATGGSLVTHPETWTLLRRHARTVWLRADASDHWVRVLAQGDDRPMRKNPQAFAQLEALLAEREPLYRQAHAVVDTAGRPVADVVEAVVACALSP